MKRFITLLLITNFWMSFGQEVGPKDADISFFAIIVNDIEASKKWYENTLGFEVINHNNQQNFGFEIYNLKLGSNKLELIELSSSINVRDSIPHINPKVRLQGLFKVGFSVDNFDNWILHIEKHKIQTQGQVVRDKNSNKRMIILLDPDGNRIQLFEK